MGNTCTAAMPRNDARFGGRAVLVALSVALGMLAIAPPVAAQATRSGAMSYAVEPRVVGNDRGGSILVRLRELRELRRSGRPVEIRGRVCFSTCTLYLDLPQTCVSPETIFGFHAPSRQGKHLPADDFEVVTRIIARHYPAPLQEWYMEEGRTRLLRPFRIRGENIIRLGVPAC